MLKCLILIYRNCVRFKSIVGEIESVKDSMTVPWTEPTLLTTLRKYELKDLFRPDEFGLFLQCLSHETFNWRAQKCSDDKKSKIRLTRMAPPNVLGEKLELIVIGKSASPP